MISRHFMILVFLGIIFNTLQIDLMSGARKGLSFVLILAHSISSNFLKIIFQRAGF